MWKRAKEVVSENRWLRYALTAFVTILLGAIGSGIWERVLAPFSNFVVTGIVRAFSTCSEYYVSSLYAGIGMADNETFSLDTYLDMHVLWLGICVCGLLYLWGDVRKLQRRLDQLADKWAKEDQGPEQRNTPNLEKARNELLEVRSDLLKMRTGIRKMKDVVRFVLLPLVFTLTVIAIGRISKDVYTHNAIIYIERSIEILSPSIGQQKTLELRAMYRTIDSADKFLSLNREMEKLAADHQVRIPAFKMVK